MSKFNDGTRRQLVEAKMGDTALVLQIQATKTRKDAFIGNVL